MQIWEATDKNYTVKRIISSNICEDDAKIPILLTQFRIEFLRYHLI